ncbi:MAG TPA: fumarylacetoacetate hydrolase family protein [Agromyces sp.]|nr:fumarylacetoacetate hydrolase family protein [Agromyces sp.]
MGRNYAEHAAELGNEVPSEPLLFLKPSTSVIGHRDVVRLPPQSGQVEHEAELAIVIGAPGARRVDRATAAKAIFGYTCANDITARDLQFSEAQWSRCKSFDGFTPTGPVVVTADEIADPQDLWLTTNVDGRILQDASTSEMVRSVAEIISYLSRSATIPAGTLISTGSPGGAGYSRNPQIFLHDGATVTVSIGGIGSLTTHCRVI